jgi:hypothetical protein
MLHPIASIAAIALAVLSASPAMAAPRDPDVPEIDAKGPWRVMHQTNEKSTSKCIGNPVTALCAAETMYACYLRNDLELCRIATGQDAPPGWMLSPAPPSPELHERYRIVLARRLRAKDGSDVPFISRGFNEDRLRPGDIMIKMQDRACWMSHGNSKCGSLNDPHEIGTKFYFVRKSANRWIVIERVGADY